MKTSKWHQGLSSKRAESHSAKACASHRCPLWWPTFPSISASRPHTHTWVKLISRRSHGWKAQATMQRSCSTHNIHQKCNCHMAFPAKTLLCIWCSCLVSSKWCGSQIACIACKKSAHMLRIWAKLLQWNKVTSKTNCTVTFAEDIWGSNCGTVTARGAKSNFYTQKTVEPIHLFWAGKDTKLSVFQGNLKNYLGQFQKVTLDKKHELPKIS